MRRVIEFGLSRFPRNLGVNTYERRCFSSMSSGLLNRRAPAVYVHPFSAVYVHPFSMVNPTHSMWKRTYLHFVKPSPEDFELPIDTMPKNIDDLMQKNPKNLDFFENYWYWRIRGEATLLQPEKLPTKSYTQLARDLGLQIVREESEHMVGLLELYEYLKSSPFIGPFGTIEKPVLVPSVNTERVVGCTGGTGDNEHVPLWFRCREGFLYRCGECDQIFMLVRVVYSLEDGEDPFPVDKDLDDVFDFKLIESGHKMWNTGEYSYWPVGDEAYTRLFQDGRWGGTSHLAHKKTEKIEG